jgi:Protein of unknown function (DUF3182)
MSDRSETRPGHPGHGRAVRGTVVTYAPGEPNPPRTHEAVTRARVAAVLAPLMRYEVGGEYDDCARYRRPLYFVPGDSIVGIDTASKLGIRAECDLFGAVVPHAFVATKSITHPLIGTRAKAPKGWCSEFASRVRDCVLEGFSAFDRDDARRAGVRLLEQGRVRIKRSRGIGGRGQFVVDDANQLTGVLERIETEEIESCGVVVEEQLDDVATYSVGQVRVAGIVASYWGTQRLTANNHGDEVYGGSSLVVVRGDFDALQAFDIAPNLQRAIEQARVYDAAAECFAGFFASRRNYDVAEGTDARGRRKSGVLEQSWRIGGASSAEAEALRMLTADPRLAAIRAASFEIYGGACAVPAGASVFFDGIDERVGPITKYVTIEGYDDHP